MWHSHLNDMEMYETKRFIPKGFELGTTLSWPIGSICHFHTRARFQLRMSRILFAAKHLFAGHVVGSRPMKRKERIF